MEVGDSVFSWAFLKFSGSNPGSPVKNSRKFSGKIFSFIMNFKDTNSGIVKICEKRILSGHFVTVRLQGVTSGVCFL